MKLIDTTTALDYKTIPIVVHGNPVDGLEFFGPFENPEEAYAWAATICLLEWWVILVHDPYEYT
jgi:hypothetical protein